MACFVSTSVSRLFMAALFAVSQLVQAWHGPVGGCAHGQPGKCGLAQKHDHQHGAHDHGGHAHHEHAHHATPAQKSAPDGQCPAGDDCVICKVLAQAQDVPFPTVVSCRLTLVEALVVLCSRQPVVPFSPGCWPRGPPTVA